jgi:hypothetical protein
MLVMLLNLPMGLRLLLRDYCWSVVSDQCYDIGDNNEWPYLRFDGLRAVAA